MYVVFGSFGARFLKRKTFAVQVEGLAIIVLQNAGDSGLNAHTITPSFFLTAALGTGSLGAMLQSIASQARTSNLIGVNLRSAVEEEGVGISYYYIPTAVVNLNIT